MSVGSFRPLGGVETLEEFKRRHPGQTSEQALDTWRAKRRGPSPTTAVPILYDVLFYNQSFSREEPLSELFRFRRAVRKIEPKSAE